MGSAAVTGVSGAIGFDTGVTEITKWVINRPSDIHDVTSMRGTGWRERKIGLHDWNGSFDTYTPLQFGGVRAIATFNVGTATTASTPTLIGTICIKDMPIETPFDDLVKYTYQFDGSGPCTMSLS